VPAEYVPWLRMKVDDLPPRDYWQTAQEDLELCTAIQQAVRAGEARADTEAREQREQDRKKAEQVRNQRPDAAAVGRLRERMGG
jgi:hypothetical protein